MNFQSILLNLSDELKAVTNKVMLVGSYTEELATDTSDIDLYVFTDSDFQGEYFSSLSGRVFNGRPVEISIIDREEVKKCIKMYQYPSYSSFDPRELERLHKIIKSKVLYQKPAFESPEFDVDIFNKKMVAYYDAYLTDIWLDLIGSYNGKDIHSTVGFADFMVETAIDAWLAHCGDTYPKSKWRAKRVLRLKEIKPDIVEHYIDHRFDIKYNKVTECPRYLADCLRLIFRLKQDIFTSELSDLPPSKAGILKPAQLYFVYESNLGFYIHTCDKVLQIDRATAEIFYCLHRNFNATDMARHLSMSGQRSADTNSIQSKIAKLLELQLLSMD
ncbi:nucleotidyltransferase domain-containing protein [Pseudomonas syringae]|uniref:nucleotidyltransferase domain-containing protein n=1 Tax=Pseudomonas syringae TaxID=317 RepID=UPI000CD9FB44|nr:nucleotidyltransferase domain-containing protein [Pseudomonas syringae]POP63755.1 hypothetical protein CXB35_27535 [Pseudomonas syringae]